MSRRGTRQPLDAPERALLAALPRLHGRGQPGELVDARILAAARDAIPASEHRAHSPRRWAAPLGVAATLVVAAGLAWQLLPPGPEPSAREEVAAVASTPAAAGVTEALPAPPATPRDGSVPQGRRLQPNPAGSIPAAPPVADQDAAATARPPAPPPPAAVTPTPEPKPLPLPPPPAGADAASPAAPEAVQSNAARESAPPAASAPVAMPSAPPAMQATTAARAAAGVSRDQPVADDDVPPATVDAPGVRDAWLRRIGELVAEGRMDEARESLAVFRKRYPEEILPPELQPLEPPPEGE